MRIERRESRDETSIYSCDAGPGHFMAYAVCMHGRLGPVAGWALMWGAVYRVAPLAIIYHGIVT